MATLKMISAIKDKSHMKRAIAYILQKEKTDGGHLVYGINTTVDSADDIVSDFMRTKKRWKKEGGRLAYHWEQSFKPGEVTPAEAHKIGQEFAQRVFSDYEVIVSTHIDKGHIHNHFIFNSVSCINGLKYHEPDSLYKEYQQINDSLCRAHGLSTIAHPREKKRSLTYSETHPEAVRKTVRDYIYEDIDDAIKKAKSVDEFWKILRVEMGYQIKKGENITHTAIKPAGHKNFFRLYKFKDGYTEADIECRIQAEIERRKLMPKKESVPIPVDYRKKQLSQLRYTLYVARRYDRRALPGIYLMYRHITISVKNSRYPRYVPFELRREISQLDKTNRATVLLLTKNLRSVHDVAAYKQQKQLEITELYGQINEVNREIRRVNRPLSEEERKEKKAELQRLRAEVSHKVSDKKLCDDIIKRSESIVSIVENEKDISVDTLEAEYRKQMAEKNQSEIEQEVE